MGGWRALLWSHNLIDGPVFEPNLIKNEIAGGLGK
jgi:hypothetical protein